MEGIDCGGRLFIYLFFLQTCLIHRGEASSRSPSQGGLQYVLRVCVEARTACQSILII